MPFVSDTSSLRALGNYYPERFPSFWELFNQEITKGNVLSVREVHREMIQQNTREWLTEWVENNSGIFLLPTQAEMEFVREIFEVPHFKTLVPERQILKGSTVADPFIIASAKISGGCVITEEGMKPNAAKIPNVCEHFSVDCIDLEGFLVEVGWQF